MKLLLRGLDSLLSLSLSVFKEKKKKKKGLQEFPGLCLAFSKEEGGKKENKKGD